MIPFDLSKFDEDENGESKTADQLEVVAKGFLDTAGLEREGAALLLARFYIRLVQAMPRRLHPNADGVFGQEGYDLTFGAFRSMVYR